MRFHGVLVLRRTFISPYVLGMHRRPVTVNVDFWNVYLLIKIDKTKWPLTSVQGPLFHYNLLSFALCFLLANQILTVTWISDVLRNVTQVAWIACRLAQFFDDHFIVGLLGRRLRNCYLSNVGVLLQLVRDLRLQIGLRDNNAASLLA